MQNARTLMFILVFGFTSAAADPKGVFGQQNVSPDLAKRDDIKALGTGRIIEKDNSIIKNIKLVEVHTYWIVYEKNSSTHDRMMEVIRRIEFPESKWGALKLEFPGNKPDVSYLIH